MDVDLVRLLTVLGRIDPAIWDAIIPHGPRLAELPAGASRASIVGFDPQPEPPGRLVGFDPQPDPPGRALLLASAFVARQIAMSAVAAEASAAEGGATRIMSRAVDDWCGTRPPHLPIPWPTPWPFPWAAIGYPGPDDLYPGPDNLYPGPDASPVIVAASRTVGAFSFASVASRLAEGEVRDAVAKGSEQLLEKALSPE